MPTARNEDAGARRHVVVIHRWRDAYAHYDDYLDHATHAVSYVTTEVGSAGVPAAAADVVLVAATDDLVEVREAVWELTRRHGAPQAVVALKEDDLLIAAQLRAEWGLAGATPQDLLPFRDKLEMCRRVRDAGLPVPAFAAVSAAADVERFAARHGWPLVLKPVRGSSSAGVRIVHGPADLAGVRWGDEAPLLVQVRRTDPIYHVDGLFRDGRLDVWRASRYVNTCLGFRDGSYLGSVEETDPAVLAAVEAAAPRFLAALTAAPTVFHLEVFVGTGPDGTPHCSFLEVGARVGGAEIPFVWRDLHGYDLMEAAFALQLGEQPAKGRPASGAVGGWLLVPAPAERPCRITAVTPMTGRVPGPYAESLLTAGEVLPAADAYYEHVGGRFRFRGATGAEVEAAIRATARDFRVRAAPA
ncbi:acetyl-CoA carboxylase biotin carboxylase subunit family protein [Kitasatospora sp. NPDC101176]|uniref:ATP-grasp domain-containing protein n=1 Tax=Kitasatospora sp. NPDC101176 TaxID=3364099 RepID=UPI00382FB5DC